jgi:hypothetical protein
VKLFNIVTGLHPRSPQNCMTTFSASLTNLTALLPQSRDSSCYWHLHRSDCRNTLIYAHTTSRTLPTCDMIVGSLTLSSSEAGDFVELLVLYSAFFFTVCQPFGSQLLEGHLRKMTFNGYSICFVQTHLVWHLEGCDLRGLYEFVFRNS